MKKTILIILIVISGSLFSMKLLGQVTIGSGLMPNKGSLLDLKERKDDTSGANSNRGLMLPRVNLQTKIDLAPEGAAFTGDEIHTGLMVYNLTDKPAEELCPGVYVWIGGTWKRVTDKGCACEYEITGSDGMSYFVYCDDFQSVQLNAVDVCTSSIPTTGESYHLMTESEYNKIWNKPVKGTTDYKFKAGESYFVNYKGWTTTATLTTASTTRTLGVGAMLPGGAPIGGQITGNKIVRCVRY